MTHIASATECPIEKFDEIMATNVRSVIFLTKLCIPHIVKTKGTIVNVSSIAGIRPVSLKKKFFISSVKISENFFFRILNFLFTACQRPRWINLQNVWH